MLPKINRLTKKNDFDEVFKKGQSIKKDFLLVKIADNDLKESRFGFVVSKKISNKAVVRNRVKRLLRKAVSDQLQDIKKSKDIIIITLPGIEKGEFSEIQEVISVSFRKLGII